MESLQYDFSTIGAATEYFSKANKLGEGGFGAVYKVRDHPRNNNNNKRKFRRISTKCEM